MEEKVKYLLSLQAIRERARIVGGVAKSGGLNHFDLREDRLDDVAEFVVSVIKVRASPVSNSRIKLSNILTFCAPSATSGRTNTTRSPLMGVGSISRSETYRVSTWCLRSGKQRVVMISNSLVAS